MAESSTAIRRRKVPVWILLVTGVLICFGVAWWMTGPAPSVPKPASGNTVQQVAPATPPPLVLGLDSKGALAQGAQRLAASKYVAARTSFERASHTRATALPAQLGIALTRWHTDGAARVVKQVERIAQTHSTQPFAKLEAGVVEAYVGHGKLATKDLRAARTAYRAQHTLVAADFASRADDLLHPQLVPGYPPVAVSAKELSATVDSAPLTAISTVMDTGLRPGLPTLLQLVGARSVAAIHDPALAVAVVMAGYDKDHPAQTITRLKAIGVASRRAPIEQLNLAIALLWNGQHDAALSTLHTLAARSANESPAIRQQAAALLKSLSARNSSGSTTSAR